MKRKALVIEAMITFLLNVIAVGLAETDKDLKITSKIYLPVSRIIELAESRTEGAENLRIANIVFMENRSGYK